MNNRKYLYLLVTCIVFIFSFGNIIPVHALVGEAPVISGDAIVIQVGGTYDPLEGITITDDVDSEAVLLGRLEYYGNFDTATAGVYEIFYYVEDSDRNFASLTRPLFVLDSEKALIYAPFTDVEMNQTFNPLDNLMAIDLKDGNITDQIEVVSIDVDPSTPGDYSVVVGVTDSDGNYAEATRNVYVYWPSEYYPTITAEDLFILLGEDYNLMEGVTAEDKTDGDITEKIILDYNELDPYTPGIYWSQYRVQNSLGLDGYGTRRIIVLDMTSSPVIITYEAYLETGMDFDSLDYAFAYDLEDGNITNQIEVVENPVDMSTAGEYTVRYKVSDSDGNIAEATMLATVEWSYLHYPKIHVENRTLYLPLNAELDPMMGVTAADLKDGDLTSQIIIEQLHLDTSVAGEYYVEYSVKNSLGLTSWESVMIYVLDTSEPILRAYDFQVDLNEELNIEWIHFEAYDLEDGDLYKSVTWDISAVDVSTAGTYPVTFMVYDSDGNYAEANCYVTVIDRSYPMLEVFDHIAYQNSDYNPLDYASAWDQEDEDLTSLIQVVKSTVKIKKIGTYFVTYSVTNSKGNTTTKTVSVEVMKEPVITFSLIYDGNLIPLETDETGQMAFITSPVMIPAGSEVGIGVYADGEPLFEMMGIFVANDILPGFTYSISQNEENQLVTSILPYLYNGVGFRYTAMEGEVHFKSTIDGSVYYIVQDAGLEPPDLYASENAIPGTKGINSIKLYNLNPGKAQIVYILIEDPDRGMSNILAIELPKTPSGPNVDKEKPEKPKDKKEDLGLENQGIDVPEINNGQEKKEDPIPDEEVIDVPEVNSGEEKKEDSVPEEEVIEVPEVNNGQEKKEDPVPEEEVIEVPEVNNGQEKKEDSAADEEVIEAPKLNNDQEEKEDPLPEVLPLEEPEDNKDKTQIEDLVLQKLQDVILEEKSKLDHKSKP